MARTRNKAQKPVRNRSGCLITTVFLWNAMILAFDIAIAYQLYRQYDAAHHYLPTNAVVMGAYVATDHSGDSPTHKPHIEYKYEIDDQEYTASRYSFVLFGQGDRDYAQSIVDQYTFGDIITIHYDPSDPSEALIDPTLSAFPAVVILFLTPFHCVGFAGIWFGRRNRSKPHLDEDTLAMSAYIIERSNTKTVLRDYAYEPTLIFFLTLAITSFASIFAVLFLADGFQSSATTVLVALLLCVLISIIQTVRYTRRHHAPGSRLTIDTAAGTLTRAGQTVDLSRILTIGILSSTNTTVNDESWFTHAVSARLDDETRMDLLVGKGYKEHADVLRRFFNRELSLVESPEPAPIKI